ncbi:hypothetical protein EPZ47_25755 [Pseudomonas viciae]|uniref:Uncharacterized protein n=1 Tax=Pseudomonas viciae TaxID=2505979 RepID=A0A4P7PQV8_9PSED|nr:hypothetical protein EPZ47_25755 [Pseudomonas viciae]
MRESAPLWRGSLLPLGRAGAPGCSNRKKLGAAAQPSGSKLPRHNFYLQNLPSLRWCSIIEHLLARDVGFI